MQRYSSQTTYPISYNKVGQVNSNTLDADAWISIIYSN